MLNLAVYQGNIKWSTNYPSPFNVNCILQKCWIVLLLGQPDTRFDGKQPE